MKQFILVIGLLGFYTVNAACPDVTGEWVATFDSNVTGETYAGVYRLSISGGNMNTSGYEVYLGDQIYFKGGGPYTINNSCKFTYRPSHGEELWSGFIVNQDEMIFVGSNPTFDLSFKAVAKRMTSGI
jgi:hypothetical protein